MTEISGLADYMKYCMKEAAQIMWLIKHRERGQIYAEN